VWRAMLIALVGAGALSGCYYDPFTGYWYAYPPYYYPYPMGPGPNPAQGYAPGAPPPANAPVQRGPLPPPS